jgi:Xaa-Pro aminopeptidase
MVPDVLIYADTARSPELRHEVPVEIGDSFLYVERSGKRHVVLSALETSRLEGFGFEVHGYEEFGGDELARSGLSGYEADAELSVRAVRALGVTSAVVPGGFPLLLADRLRAAGVELLPQPEFFTQRRRIKRRSNWPWPPCGRASQPAHYSTRPVTSLSECPLTGG